MGRLIIVTKAAACSFLLLFAILHSYVISAAAAQKTVTSTPSTADLTVLTVSGTGGGGADYCAPECKDSCRRVTNPPLRKECEWLCQRCCGAKCRDRCESITNDKLRKLCEGLCERCCAETDYCVPDGPVGEGRSDCIGWSTRSSTNSSFIYRCP